MLKKFEVQGFRGFKEKICFDLSKTNNYDFNSQCIKNRIVNKAIIYGHNGSGKSNLGLAILDIVSSMTQMDFPKKMYSNYKNGYLFDKDNVYFKYTFEFYGSEVIYSYEKDDRMNILSEDVYVDGRHIMSFDISDLSSTMVNIPGTENLNLDFDKRSQLGNYKQKSLLLYIINNSNLPYEENRSLLRFFIFVNEMLFFRSVREDNHIGCEFTRSYNVDPLQDIIDKNLVGNFESFLNEAGIACKLDVFDGLEGKDIVFIFGDRKIPFSAIASSGTVTLALLYSWLIRIEEDYSDRRVSFVFIDEFDAYYHYDLAKIVINRLVKNDVQVVLTTHNTGIISNEYLRPDCYFTIENNSVKSFAESVDKELRVAHNLEKMYRAGSFNHG